MAVGIRVFFYKLLHSCVLYMCTHGFGLERRSNSLPLCPPPLRPRPPLFSASPSCLAARSAPRFASRLRNYYDTLAKVFGQKGVPQQMPALMKALPQNKRKLLQDVVDGLSKK